MQRRPRRLRQSVVTRAHAHEARLHVSQLVYPLFVVSGTGIKEEIVSLPGNYRLSVDLLLTEIAQCIELGLRSFILFPVIPESLKDKYATYSYSTDNFYLKAISDIKTRYPGVCVVTDVAMDPYSSDGHDGLVNERGEIENDATLPILAKMAVAQARAGADIIGPSDMMDGRVGYLRRALDEAGYTNTGIMAYTAKYASAYYGPFRDALDSAPRWGDKKTYQMNPANSREALVEAELDFQEGADYLMVKPALHYLDVIRALRQQYPIPIAAYHVSGECAMLMAACRNGWLRYEQAMPEALLAIRRAGADVILTYFAKDFAQMFGGGI